jgi:antitoxin HicB
MDNNHTTPNNDPQHMLPSKAAKLLLLQEFQAQKLRHVDLAKRLGTTRQFIQRLLDPESVTKIDTINGALVVIGKRLIVSLTDL